MCNASTIMGVSNAKSGACGTHANAQWGDGFDPFGVGKEGFVLGGALDRVRCNYVGQTVICYGSEFLQWTT